MIDLLRAMFSTPEAQPDPYVWAAALMGHWAVGAALTALVMAIWQRGAWASAAMLSVAYLVGWEGGQLVGAAWDLSVAITTPLLWDCVLDWIAVTLGAVTAAAIWQHRRRIIGVTVAATVIILTAGLGRRK